MSNIISTGVSGLNAAKVGLAVTSHNVSNVGTKNYNKQHLEQAASQPYKDSFGFVGTGVQLTQILRDYNSFLDREVLNAQSSNNFYTSQLALLKQIDDVLGDPKIGLNQAIQDVFSSLQTLSNTPSEQPARQAALGMFQLMTAKFKALDSRFAEIQAGINTQLGSAVGSINELARQIASLNQQILAASAGSELLKPNDLMDKRDLAVQELNKLIKADKLVQSDGRYSIFIGNGQSLVLGNSVIELSTQTDPTDPRNVHLVAINPNGAPPTPIPDQYLVGGDVGGWLAVRNGPLAQTQKQLGDLAIDLTTAFNYQQDLGLDLNGLPGAPIFTDLTSYATKPDQAIVNMALLLGDPAGLACASNMLAGPVTDLNLPPNALNLSVSNIVATLPGNYGWPDPATAPGMLLPHPSKNIISIDVTRDASAGTFEAKINGGSRDQETVDVVADPVLLNTFKLVTRGAHPEDIGISFTLSGQPQPSMQFAITKNVAGPAFGMGNADNLFQMLQLQTKPLVDNTRNGGVTSLQTFQTAYAKTVSYVGSVTNDTKLASEASALLLKENVLARSNYSGVNLDEEAANLLRYQQAYIAAGKVIEVANATFNQVLQLF